MLSHAILPCFIAAAWSLMATLQAQTMHTIRGVVTDTTSDEPLPIATVLNLKDSTGIAADADGQYTLTVQGDSAWLQFSYVGYAPKIYRFALQKNAVLNVALKQISLENILVHSYNYHSQLGTPKMSIESVTAQQAKEVAALMGEADVIKLLQLKPGVQAPIEGSSGLLVRGGSVDQNLFLMDGTPLYNPSHLLGLFSTFNNDVVKKTNLYKGGFPAQYGGRLSSVVDTRLREGDLQEFRYGGGLGLIAARLFVEGPIVRDKGSFLISGRSSYAHPILQAINNDNTDNANWFNLPVYHFYDANLKANWIFDSKNRLYLSGYTGGDWLRYQFSENSADLSLDLVWSNQAASLRWAHFFSDHLSLNTTASYTRYNNAISTQYANLKLSLNSGIEDVQLKSDLLWTPNLHHEFRAGGSLTRHQFKVGQLNARSVDGPGFKRGNILSSMEWMLYASEEWHINTRWILSAGLRWNHFHTEGHWYQGLSPRLQLSYNHYANWSIKASYSRTYQFMHLVAPATAPLPTDIWYPSTKHISPQYADTYVTGFHTNLGKGYHLHIEGYYKSLSQQIDFRDGARIFINDRLDEEFIRGRGWSYGGEFYLEKQLGDFRGWISYTLAWTWRQFDAINNGQPFHPPNDRRHDLAVVLLWDIPFFEPKFPLTLSTSWTYSTGKTITLPRSRYIMTDITGTNLFQFIPIYNERGNYHLPDYHRLDLGLIWQLYPKSKKRFKSDLTFSVYNVYDRRNAFFMYIQAIYPKNDPTAAIPDKLEGRIVSLLPIIPSITWNFYW